MSDVCAKCDGCGQVANSEDGEPWKEWEQLPEQSRASVHLGLVKPLTCPNCGGTGYPPPPVPSADSGATSPLSAGETTPGSEACDTSAPSALSDSSEAPRLLIPYMPIAGEDHAIVLTTRYNAALVHIETDLSWHPRTSMPELLTAGSTFVDGLARIMAQVATGLEQGGQESEWAKTNAAILFNIAKGIACMGQIVPTSSGEPN